MSISLDKLVEHEIALLNSSRYLTTLDDLEQRFQSRQHPWLDDFKAFIEMCEWLIDLPCVTVNRKREYATDCPICQAALAQRDAYMIEKENNE